MGDINKNLKEILKDNNVKNDSMEDTEFNEIQRALDMEKYLEKYSELLIARFDEKINNKNKSDKK